MSTAPIIVNYSQITNGFAGGAREAIDSFAGARQGDDLESAMYLATFERAMAALRDAEVEADVMTSPDDPVAATLQTVLAENAHELGVPLDAAAGGREIALDQFDIRWARSLIGLMKMHLNVGKFDFRPGPTRADAIPDKARIGILGDWGTNLYGAPHCSRSLMDDEDGFDAIVHLGDVYYTGSKNEVQGRFLAGWPFRQGTLNRACNSNHEMFSGGVPYAQQTLTRFEQSSSLFWLENTSWVLLGLDSAYDDGKLGPLQVDWITTICERAASTNKRVLFFSHHQPWRTDTGEEQVELVAPIRRVLTSGQVFGWYWGHEHLCSLFEPHPTWQMWGACVGHSGFPYTRLKAATGGQWRPSGDPVADDGRWHAVPQRGAGATTVPQGLLLDGPNIWIPGHEAKFGPNGFAVLELDGEHLRELVFSASGEQVHERELA